MASLRVIASIWACASLVGCGASSQAPPPADAFRMPVTYSGPTRPLLAKGEALPKLECEGWINGEPKPFAANGPALHVVDVWSQWCPECQKLAASLQELHGRYHDRNVQFVSVSDLPRDAVERFASENRFTWPCGYGLKDETVVALGAVNSGMGSTMPGYLVAPTIFVVGPDGKVRGTDGQARWRHRPTRDTVALVAKVIDEALAEADAKPAK